MAVAWPDFEGHQVPTTHILETFAKHYCAENCVYYETIECGSISKHQVKNQFYLQYWAYKKAQSHEVINMVI